MTIFIAALILSGCQTVGRKDFVGEVISPAPMKPVVEDFSQNEIFATDLSFNTETGEIGYTLSEPAFVRLRVGIREGGPMLRTLVSWERREAGAHVEKWDMKDTFGRVSYRDRPDLMVAMTCLRPNSDGGPPLGVHQPPQMDITFPETKTFGPMGEPVLSGIAVVRVTIDPEDIVWLTETKYEMGMFIDNIFLAEDEEGINPYNYMFNTKGLNDGPHVFTVNITGYEGDVGSSSVSVLVDNSG